MFRPVAVEYFGQAPVNVRWLAVWGGGHVAEGERVGERLGRGFELAAEDVGEVSLLSLDDGAGVMGDQAAQHRGRVLDIAEVAGSVQGVQACLGKLGKVADVVQPRGCLEEFSIGGGRWSEAACPGGHALDMGPAPRKGVLQEVAGEVFGPGGK
jgi:hypothetical protein